VKNSTHRKASKGQKLRKEEERVRRTVITFREKRGKPGREKAATSAVGVVIGSTYNRRSKKKKRGRGDKKGKEDEESTILK